MTQEVVEIRATRAVADRELCKRFVDEHAAVLRSISMAGVVESEGAWLDDPRTVLVCAHHETLGLVGGVRVVCSGTGRDLPMQSALRAWRRDLDIAFTGIDTSSNAELCGVWSARRYAGRGLGRLLIAAGVATARLERLRTLTCLAASYTADVCRSLGFVPLQIGADTALPYPVAGMQSWAMAQRDLSTMQTADPRTRAHVLDLCARPKRARIERPRATELRVHYDLTTNRVTPVA